MYQDEHEEVIHDTLEAEEKALEDKADEILSEHLLVKHLRNIVKQEISKRFDEQPTSYNSFKEEEMKTLIDRRLEWFLESDDFRDKVKEEIDNYIDDCYVDISTTAYITKG